jgi:diaminopropionate ammonia-lyase
VPVLVMQGYTVLLREALEQLNTRPIHLLVQAGVGGLAAAVSTHLSCVWGEERPTLVIVEPRRAACLYGSAAATADALRRLTYPLQGDPAIVARGSGGAGLAGLMPLTGNPDARGALGPGPSQLARTWHVATKAFAPASSASLFGILVGAPLLGYLGDRFGPWHRQ